MIYILLFRLIFRKTLSHNSQSRHMEISHLCLYYAGNLKVVKYICKNQNYACWITWIFVPSRIPNYIFYVFAKRFRIIFIICNIKVFQKCYFLITREKPNLKICLIYQSGFLCCFYEDYKSHLLLSKFNSTLSCRANQWTGFYMITGSVMKGLI